MARYRLKTMVLARMLAEATVCSLFIGLPIFLQISGALSGFPNSVKAMVWCLGAIGLLLLPWFGFVTWLVSTSETGITTHSLFRNQRLGWDKVKNLTRRSSWAWLRFVVEGEEKGSDLSFPVVLNKIDELVAEISSHLPATAGRLRSVHRVFVYDRLAYFPQMLQSLAAIVFAVVFWCFFVARRNISHNNTDTALLFGFCAVITLIFAWRMKVVATMPKSVETTRAGLSVTTHFGNSKIEWSNIKGVGVPVPLLPEGFTIKTTKGSILIGAAMECADELQGFVRTRAKGVVNSNRAPVDIEEAVSALDFDVIKGRIDEQSARSRDLLEALKEQGVDVTMAREIDHCFYAQTHHDITGLGQNLADQGFEVDVFAPIEAEGVKIDLWTMKMRVKQSPDEAGGEKNAAYMMGLADEYQCVYDGWAPDLSSGSIS